MLTREKLKALFPNATEDFIARTIEGRNAGGLAPNGNAAAVQPPVGTAEAAQGTAGPDCKAPAAKSKSPVRGRSLEQVSRAKANPPRVLIRVTSFRRRLIDPDNAVEKYFVDFLRHCGALYDDTPDLIEIQFAQVKVETAEEDGITKLEIIPEHLWKK
jgi:hypothetical protein